jgi:hypothetical protein
MRVLHPTGHGTDSDENLTRSWMVRMGVTAEALRGVASSPDPTAGLAALKTKAKRVFHRELKRVHPDQAGDNADSSRQTRTLTEAHRRVQAVHIPLPLPRFTFQETPTWTRASGRNAVVEVWFNGVKLPGIHDVRYSKT